MTGIGDQTSGDNTPTLQPCRLIIGVLFYAGCNVTLRKAENVLIALQVLVGGTFVRHTDKVIACGDRNTGFAFEFPLDMDFGYLPDLLKEGRIDTPRVMSVKLTPNGDETLEQGR